MTTETKDIKTEKAAQEDNILPKTGFLRLTTVLNLIPVSRSTWFAHRGSRYPLPVDLGPRIRAYRVEDIRALIEKGTA